MVEKLLSVALTTTVQNTHTSLLFRVRLLIASSKYIILQQTRIDRLRKIRLSRLRLNISNTSTSRILFLSPQAPSPKRFCSFSQFLFFFLNYI